MRLLGTGTGVVAIAAYRDKHFQGYAVRTPDEWLCVVALGMGWSKIRAHSAEDARTTLRTTSHASRFENYRDIDDLIALIAKLPPYKAPGIMPEEIAGLPAKLPKLAS
jgi:hypothetical protein